MTKKTNTKPKQGRPRKMVNGRADSLYLPEAHWEHIKKLGNGSYSAGAQIVIAADMAREACNA